MDAYRGPARSGVRSRAAELVARLRERAGTALLVVAADLARDRRAVVARIAEVPAGAPGRDLALGNLAIGGWVESVLLWLGWRLLPGDAVTGRATTPRP